MKQVQSQMEAQLKQQQVQLQAQLQTQATQLQQQQAMSLQKAMEVSWCCCRGTHGSWGGC